MFVFDEIADEHNEKIVKLHMPGQICCLQLYTFVSSELFLLELSSYMGSGKNSYFMA